MGDLKVRSDVWAAARKGHDVIDLVASTDRVSANTAMPCGATKNVHGLDNLDCCRNAKVAHSLNGLVRKVATGVGQAPSGGALLRPLAQLLTSLIPSRGSGADCVPVALFVSGLSRPARSDIRCAVLSRSRLIRLRIGPVAFLASGKVAILIGGPPCLSAGNRRFAGVLGQVARARLMACLALGHAPFAAPIEIIFGLHNTALGTLEFHHRVNGTSGGVTQQGAC